MICFLLMYTKSLSHTDTYFYQECGGLVLCSVTSRQGNFSPLLSLAILFSLLTESFIICGMEISITIHFCFLNVILFTILLMYIRISGLPVVSCISWCFTEHFECQELSGNSNSLLNGISDNLNSCFNDYFMFFHV